MIIAAEGGLTPSRIYADRMVAAITATITGLEQAVASLEAQDYGGDAVAGFRAAIPLLQQAASNIDRSCDALATGLPVRDSYQASPGIGSKNSVMGASDPVSGDPANLWPANDSDAPSTGRAARGNGQDIPAATVDGDPAEDDEEEEMWALLGDDGDDSPITHCVSCDKELDQPTHEDEEGYCRYCRDGAPDFCWTGAPTATGELDEREHMEPFKRLSELAWETEDSRDGRYRDTPGEFAYGSCVVKLPGGKQMDAREWVEQPATQRLLAEIPTAYQSETVTVTCVCGAAVTGKVHARGYLGSTATATGEEQCAQCHRNLRLSAPVTLVKGLKVFNTVEFTITCRCGASMPGVPRTVRGLPGETVKIAGAGHCDSCGTLASHWGQHVMQGADPVEAPQRIHWNGTWRRGLLPEVVDELLWLNTRDDIVAYLCETGLGADALGVIAGVLGHPQSGTTLDEHRLGIATALLPHIA